MNQSFDTFEDIFLELKDLIEHTSDPANNTKHKYMYCESLSKYYYQKVDSHKELFCAELPDHVGVYNSIEFGMNIEELATSTQIPAHATRDIVKYFRKFCYYNGYKYNGTGHYQTIDDSQIKWSGPEITVLNHYISTEQLTTQQVGLLLQLLDKWGYISRNNLPLDTTMLICDILNEFIATVDYYEPETKMEWNKLGGLMDMTYNQLHHRILEEM
jgi:hypothetical protein